MIYKDIRFYSKHFISVPRRDGMLEDLSANQHPTLLHGWGYTKEPLTVREEGTHFGFVVDGLTHVTRTYAGLDQVFTLTQGMYFCVPGSVSVHGGCGILISSLRYHGMFMIGGPIEKKGRLLYMDGCSDALLVPPTIKGDPCLNHLHFPPSISQTRHTHPSIRIGVVTSGKGRCIVPENENGTGSDIKIPLTPGQIFVIPAGGQHSFFTDDSTLDIIAYHPDSDTGPTHDDHPMINRTFVNGISARNIEKIRTKSIAENIVMVGEERTPLGLVVNSSTHVDTTQAAGAESTQPESVLGPDDRRNRILRTTDSPYKAICQILAKFPNGMTSRSTGCFITQKNVLTAGHSLYIPSCGGCATEIEVIPGRDGESRPFDSQVTTLCDIAPSWINNSDSNCDYAVIHLPDNSLGKQVGWLELADLPDSSLLGRRVNISGYPADKLIGTQWDHGGTITSVEKQKIYYDIDTSGGQSGSPVYYCLDGQYYVVGIHAYGDRLNSATRIRPEVIDNIRLWNNFPGFTVS